ncbi:lactate dehydrogenase-like 2-hydroxyacid dehydrogenase [Pseudonocardia sediminis]|uniref:Lactate dehydrogenase-like 2-hydroxyacid dehydrogenase n=1 Tax=Pseudonocardia sediminis TaxID=1397368 RepID=A0A4Q7UTP0_PSEST|nr:NAD(P)-dependent oxidoreductase [Pseudonocardia sediminis]RZT85287.1 lactate dehydrogenase-like 2-hydroxyacid dehydrogenase [Pseudonocardia sediminis]
MRIGLVGGAFPDVRRMLRDALPGAELIEIAEDGNDAPAVDVLVPLGARVDATLLDATGARMVQQFGVGVQGVDLDAARERGIPVTNVPGSQGNAVAVAELAVFHLLALRRRYPQARAAVAERHVGGPIGRTLSGSTVTVLGVGASGTALVERLHAFRVDVWGAGRRDRADYPDADALLAPGRYVPVARLHEALAHSDALVVCVPLTDDTLGLVGTDVLAAMPAGGLLVNVGRGPVVDRDALLTALRSGHLAGAGLDVAWTEPIDPADELFDHDVVVTPHVAGVTEDSYRTMADTFAANVHRLERGEPLENVVT